MIKTAACPDVNLVTDAALFGIKASEGGVAGMVVLPLATALPSAAIDTSLLVMSAELGPGRGMIPRNVRRLRRIAAPCVERRARHLNMGVAARAVANMQTRYEVASLR